MSLLESFLETYKEFKPLLDSDSGLSDIQNTFKKVICLYPQFRNIESDTQCAKVYPFFMLVAHYLVISGRAGAIGLNKSVGIVSSSSIDGVSVSYQTMQTKDNFQYFFNQTPYGQEYLSYLNTQSGLMLVN